MDPVYNVINKKFDDETIKFLLKNSSDGSIINSVLKLSNRKYIVLIQGEWQFKHDNREDN